MSRSLIRPAAALVMCLAVVLTGCQATVDVTVLVDDERGSGDVVVSVTLDREAVDRLEGIDGLRTDDLVAAGWEVDEPITDDDGGAAITVSKPFASPTEMAAVLEEISGPDGPYARLGLRAERSFARTEYTFEGVLDGSMGIAGLADPGLAAALDGLPFGVDLAALEAELGEPLGPLVDLGLAVSLPGDQEGNLQPEGTVVYATTDASRPVLVWQTDLAAPAPVPVLATSEESRPTSIAFAIAALAFAALFVLVLLLWVVVLFRRRRKRRKAARAAASLPRPIGGVPIAPDPDDTPVPPSAPVPAAVAASGAAAADGLADAPPEPEPEAGPPPLELVVIGGPGVAFGVRDPIDDVVAFARSRGSMLEYPRIAEHYAEAELGRLSTAELWVAVGAEGDPAMLDEELLGQYGLAPGLRDFVARARERGYRVAYLGDGPTAWVDHLRRSFVLGDLIDPWVVSGGVGARTPDTAIFEALRRISGVEPASCLLIDDRLRVLEAARLRGFGTAWFSPTGRSTEAPGHSIIRGFADLLSS